VSANAAVHGRRRNAPDIPYAPQLLRDGGARVRILDGRGREKKDSIGE